MTENEELRKQEFIAVYRQHIKRAGADELLRWLEESDFFSAPASSKYHLNIPGGLCMHSINVFKRLDEFLSNEYGENGPYSKETIAIVALLHDICKTNTYRLGWKNQKTYDLEKVAAADRWQVKRDSAGDFIWETVPTYEFDEQFVFGHGEKSVYLIRDYMALDGVEATAIRYHMGSFREGEAKDAGKVFSMNPLAFFLHIADSAATFLDEKE